MLSGCVSGQAPETWDGWVGCPPLALDGGRVSGSEQVLLNQARR